MKNLILSGMPMSGKSYWGKKVAEKLNHPFIDTDTLVEEAAGMACHEIVMRDGFQAFRQLEKQIIRDLNCRKTIIALGGAAILDAENAAQLKQKGVVLYLKAAPETLLGRLPLKGRIPAYLDPQNPETSLKELWRQRDPLYERYADLVIDLRKLNEPEVLALICEQGAKHGL